MTALTPAPEIFHIGDLEIRFHRDPAQTDRAVAVFESVIPPGARVPVPHRHVDYDEQVFGLAGTCRFSVESREIPVGPGDVLFIPRGQAHGFANRGSETARVLVIVTPGLLGPDYFRQVAAVFAAGGPPDLAHLAAIMQRHGMTPVPPGANAAGADLR